MQVLQIRAKKRITNDGWICIDGVSANSFALIVAMDEGGPATSIGLIEVEGFCDRLVIVIFVSQFQFQITSRNFENPTQRAPVPT